MRLVSRCADNPAPDAKRQEGNTSDHKRPHEANHSLTKPERNNPRRRGNTRRETPNCQHKGRPHEIHHVDEAVANEVRACQQCVNDNAKKRYRSHPQRIGDPIQRTSQQLRNSVDKIADMTSSPTMRLRTPVLWPWALRSAHRKHISPNARCAVHESGWNCDQEADQESDRRQQEQPKSYLG
jgi:hypothetical protein